MEDHHSHSLPHSSHPSDNATPHVTSAQDHVADAGGSTNGARYRLMSPAKLPISRSTCITIPPGLSPTSFLESPVLLSNIKAEPSPTTGSFFKPQLMQVSGGNAAVPLERGFTCGNTVDERSSGGFEFRFHTGVSSTSGLSSAGMSIPLRMNRNGLVTHQDQRYSQSAAPSSLASQSPAVARQDSSAYDNIDELNQGGQSNTGTQASVSEHKENSSSVSAERTSEDGYNWRKYGQKLVKGSEFPRSYYKCTYPNCEVKKIFERSPSGQITEIVYKGSHDHPKPQSARRHNPGALLSIQEDKLDKGLSLSGQEDKTNTNNMEQSGSPMLSPLQANEEGMDGTGPQFQGINDDVEDDDPYLKRRKMEDGIDVTPVVKPIREPRVVVQTVSEVDILDDGYRWRKYGQKVVRGNPNPRSYYKCTNAGCPVRKHVERASHDPKAVITTYEGKHNHDVPTARNNSHEFAGSTAATKMMMRGAQERSSSSSSMTISLDLGVGIGRAGENSRSDEGVDGNAGARSQIGSNQIPVCYDIVNGGLNLYGNRETRDFQTPPINASNQCPQNLGRILMGP
ncbi:WRKY family transcription factor family protein [Perilla frutescens var. hirtella]|uniref:WRKY family transcription factor family protein n=1 Tax=Perilla frutescens var. hirtella TaxID=608512 RepID=A0AAD4IW66_PERFH|nr:WRKY family transcription factor family protein [Perilla frutescens var. hirtella]